MNVASITSTTQAMWEELRQQAMKNTPQTVSASNGDEVSLVAADQREIDKTEAAAAIRQVNARRQSAATEPSGPATTALEGAGPNLYEKIRQNADKTYLAQSMNETGAHGALQTRLHKSV